MSTILFVENDRDFLDTRAEFLTIAGHEVVKAYTLEQAREKLDNTYVHLAILDIRMRDDDDEKDTSGITLAQDPAYRLIPKIILTNFPSTKDAIATLRVQKHGLQPAVNFLKKSDGPDIMIAAVAEVLEQHIHINWDLDIAWKARDRFSLVNLIKPDLNDELILIRAQEFEDLFRKLFYEKDQIRIERLLWHRAGRIALVVFTFKTGTTPEHFIVTCGQREQMQIEAQNYNEFSPKAPGDTGVILSSQVETTRYAANLYTLAGANLENIQTLSEAHKTHSEKEIGVILKSLLQQTLFSWHEGQRTGKQQVSLDELYRLHLNLTVDQISQGKLKNCVKAILDQIPKLNAHIEHRDATLSFQFGGRLYNYPEPVPFISRKLDLDDPVVLRKSPGDFSDTNILTDGLAQTWLTDFNGAGMKPLLWDFVAIEAIVRYDWDTSTRFGRLCELEQCLVKSEFFSLNDKDVEPEVRKTLRFIQTIRRLAYETIGESDLPYHTGLFFQAMKRIAAFEPNNSLTNQELARLTQVLLSAAMLAEKVFSTKKAHFEHTLKIKEGTVFVRGVSKKMRGKKYDLLSYLHKHANKVCKRADIIQHLYNVEVETNYERDSLNALVSRLRGEIEINPKKPNFLHTETGVGYRLTPSPDK